jgi:hypothetical protein
MLFLSFWKRAPNSLAKEQLAATIARRRGVSGCGVVPLLLEIGAECDVYANWMLTSRLREYPADLECLVQELGRQVAAGRDVERYNCLAGVLMDSFAHRLLRDSVSDRHSAVFIAGLAYIISNCQDKKWLREANEVLTSWSTDAQDAALKNIVEHCRERLRKRTAMDEEPAAS